MLRVRSWGIHVEAEWKQVEVGPTEGNMAAKVFKRMGKSALL